MTSSANKGKFLYAICTVKRMKNTRSDQAAKCLLDNTVFEQWLKPFVNCLSQVRYSENRFLSLPMNNFLMFCVFRQIQAITTLRESVQNIFHLNTDVSAPPVPRSTMSDALSSTTRRNIIRAACENLITLARKELPDKLSFVHGIGQREVIAIDATYQTESTHFHSVSTKEGGNDNSKGHLLMTFYDVRKGIPIYVNAETASIGEMRLLKEIDQKIKAKTRVKNGIFVVDRAFIAQLYWKTLKETTGSTVITRTKSTFVFDYKEFRDINPLLCNEKVVSDQLIDWGVKKGEVSRWRLITWKSPEGLLYEYITNDLDLEPGTIAFLYYKRWDEEKYFDNFKNDLGNSQAWGKSIVSIEQQALFGMSTYILTMLFLNRHRTELGLLEDTTQKRKKEKRIEKYLDGKALETEIQKEKENGDIDNADGAEMRFKVDNKSGDNILMYDAYRAYYSQLSKITRQVWRFLKNCYREKSVPGLYERQLKPLLTGYL